jgi:predicted TIM-barrel fold metal-dependent hydrolase
MSRFTASTTSKRVRSTMDTRPIDADNHLYEPLEAFTRHLDRAFVTRGPQPMKDARGHTQLLIGGKVCRFVPNPTFDPIVIPGCLDAFFRGQIPDDVDRRSIMKVEPLGTHPEYRDRDARIDVLDQQGLGAIVLFPTLACGMEQALKDDIPATVATLSSYNRWLEETWGFHYRDRIYGVPMLSLADPVAAVDELERLINAGARIVHVRPAPVPSEHGESRSLGHPCHDPVWARLAEAGTPVGFHLGDSGYNSFAAAWGASGSFEGYGKNDVLSRVLVSDRAIHDTIAALILDGVFKRHSNLRVASIENGSDWIQLLVKRLQKQRNQTPWAFAEDPLDTLRHHVWVTPYCEEDLLALADLIGADRVLFGSDWPHGEGLARPLDFEAVIADFDDVAQQRIMRENCVELLGI